MSREPNSQPQSLARELAETAKALSEAGVNKAHPADTYALLQDLGTAMDSLKQVTAQLSWWHSRAIRGSDYVATSDTATVVEDAAAQILAASRFLSAARDSLRAAEGANSEVRWKRRPSPGSSVSGV